MTGPAWALLLVGILVAGGCAPSVERARVASFGRALRAIDEHYVRSVDQQELHASAMEALVESLGDPYSRYLSPERMAIQRERRAGQYGQVGLAVWRSIDARDGYAVVTEVEPGGPAAEAGIQAGDLLRPIGEERPLISDWRVRGAVGGRYTFAVLRPSTGDERRVELVCRAGDPPAVQWRMVEPGIALVEIPACREGTARQVADALDAAGVGGFAGLIVDLRANGGGQPAAAAEICDLFLGTGEMFSTVGRSRETSRTFSASSRLAVGSAVPIAVLVDGRTASSGELIAAVLRARGRATIVGTSTFGKHLGTITGPLPDGSGLRLAAFRLELADGSAMDARGVRPDVRVGRLAPPPETGDAARAQHWLEQYLAARRAQLARAVEMLESRLLGH